MKFLFKTLKVFLIISIIGLLALVAVGYVEYKVTIDNTSIEEVVEAAQKEPHYTPISEINTVFLDALVATEDHRFYKHGGLDVISVTRAALTNITKGEILQGGSTITQQLAKNLFLSHEKTMLRKIKEMFLAYELEKRYSKDELLELYANIIYYGDGNTGIYNASQNYFHKSPSDLNYDEATLLAGLPQSPSRFALSTHLVAAKNRQKQVIEALQTFAPHLESDYVYEY